VTSLAVVAAVVVVVVVAVLGCPGVVTRAAETHLQVLLSFGPVTLVAAGTVTSVDAAAVGGRSVGYSGSWAK